MLSLNHLLLDVKIVLFCPHTELRTWSTAAPYDILVTDGWMHDVDEDDWDRWSAINHFVLNEYSFRSSGVNTYFTEAYIALSTPDCHVGWSPTPSCKWLSLYFRSTVSLL